MPEFLVDNCSPAGFLVVVKDDETFLDPSYQVIGVALAGLLVGERETQWVILSPKKGVSSVVSGRNFYWSPQGHSLLIQAENQSWSLYPEPDAEARPLSGVDILGWWHQNQLSATSGEIFNLDLEPTGERVWQKHGLTTHPQYSISSADLRQVDGTGHTIIFNRENQMVAGFGGMAGIWSPTGDRVLTQTRIFGPAGIQQLQLPVGSTPVAWLDEGHILAERYLSFPHRYFTYNLTDGQILYLPELDTENLFPRGDGKTIAWVIEGDVLIGEMKPWNEVFPLAGSPPTVVRRY